MWEGGWESVDSISCGFGSWPIVCFLSLETTTRATSVTPPIDVTEHKGIV